MSLNKLTKDPIFQLNILIWMAKEQPEHDYQVMPLLFKSGFKVRLIESQFPLPEKIKRSLIKHEINASLAPEPDLVLVRQNDGRALYIEAKSDSFSPNSDASAKQARGHLVATGDAFSEVLAPYEPCLLSYVTPEECTKAMCSTLEVISGELKEKAISCGNYSCTGFSVSEGSLHFCWDDQFAQHLDLVDNSSVIMTDLSEDTDPSPLYFVYSVDDYPDPERQDQLRKILINRIHGALLSSLQRQSVGVEYTVTADDLLKEVTQGYFDLLGSDRKKSMRKFIKEKFFRRIVGFGKDRFQGSIRQQLSPLSIVFLTVDAKKEFLDWLEDYNRTKFEPELPPPDGHIQEPLFP